MEKYVTNIKDLVIQALTNDSEIKAKAESGDALSCFQMGMIHLLGINTPIDFKKASKFLSNQSLSDDPDANRLLGFIAECEGNYSQAFKNYAQTNSSEKDSFLDRVIMGRNHIQDYMKKLDLPIMLNKEVSSLLTDYAKGKASRTGACIKIAAICNDKPSCLEAANALYETKDYISAIQWLKKGDVGADNSIYASISERVEKAKKELLDSKVLQVVDLESNSLLSKEDPTQFLSSVKKACDEASKKCFKDWVAKSKTYVDAIIKEKKDKEQNEYLAALAEEEARKKKRNKLIKYSAIAATAFIIVLLASIGSSSDDKVKGDETVSKEIIASDNGNTNSKVIGNSDEELDRGTDTSGYNNILSERKLSEDDISDKTKSELEIMRNSIYARYGYKFKREDLLNHFSQYSWYNPTTSDMGTIYNMMNDNEKYNVDFIKKHE